MRYTLVREDPLQFISTIALYQFCRKYKKIVRIIQYIVFMMTESVTVWVLFLIIDTRNTSYIKRYLLVQAIQQNSCATMYVHIQLNTTINQLQDGFQEYFVSLKKDSNIIRKEIVVIQVVAILMFFLMLWIHLDFLIVNGFNAKDSVYYPTVYFENKINKYVLIVLSLPHMFIMTFEVVYVGWTVVYLAMHLKFQLDALRRYLKDKISDLKVDERICMEDKNYQEIVYRRLRFCVQRHVKLKRIFKEQINKIAAATLLLSLITASLVTIAAFYFILDNVNPTFNSIMYGVLIYAATEYFLANYYGQMISDASENFYSELARCPWCYWDKRNRDILQMLLNASKTPLEISCYGLLELGFPLLLRGFRFCYTLFALVNNT